MKTSPIISVENLSMEIDKTKILDNISLEIKEGDALGIIGISGAGKSVFLNVLRGSIIPTEGRIIYTLSVCKNCGWLDRPSLAGKKCPICSSKILELEKMDFWKDPEIRKKIRKRTAIMLQRSFALYSDDTVIDNVLKILEENNFKGDKIQKAVDLLKMVNLSHRGASGSEENTGDGAGILIQLPDSFLRQQMAAKGISLPEVGDYGAGMVFLPQDEKKREEIIDLVENFYTCIQGLYYF